MASKRIKKLAADTNVQPDLNAVQPDCDYSDDNSDRSNDGGNVRQDDGGNSRSDDGGSGRPDN